MSFHSQSEHLTAVPTQTHGAAAAKASLPQPQKGYRIA